MSFIFGNAFKQAQMQNEAATRGAGPPSGSGDDGRKPPDSSSTSEKKVAVPVSQESGTFDPSRLERAAKAMKELNESKYSKQALALADMQDSTRQMSYQVEAKQHGLYMSQLEINRIQEEADKRLRKLDAETEEMKKKSQYEDQLSRKRYDDQLAQQHRQGAENIKREQRLEEEKIQKERQLLAEKFKQQDELTRRQEESIQKQETMRRATMEHEAELKHKLEMQRIEAKLRGKAQADRENREINLEKLKAKASEERITALQAIEMRSKIITEGIANFVTDWDKISATIAGLSLLALGVYSARGLTTVATKYAEARIGKPKLVRETSRLTLRSAARSPVKTARRLYEKPEDVLKGIVLKPTLAEELQNVTIATANTRINNGVYRNLLFYGPPGTGKTMFAKSLARRCGMDYAIMTGGDVLPMGADAVTAIHKVFDWAQTSRRGLLLFVDEADAFLKHRTKENVNEDLRSALNAFLYRTGEQSSKFMLVLASNKPGDLDRAIEDRLDDMIHFGLPDLAERQHLVKQYFNNYVEQPLVQPSWFGSSGTQIELSGFKDLSAKLEEVAVVTDGFSGREISKLAVAWQSGAFANDACKLSEQAFDERVANMLEQHKQKGHWSK